MEVASIILAVTNLIDPLLRLGYHTSKSLKRSSHFGVDAEKLRVSFNREKRQVEALRRLLLMKATTVFEQFDDLWQADLLDELRQLRALTRGLEEIESRYDIFAVIHVTTPPLQVQPPTEEVVNLVLADEREAKLQRAATTPQLIRWGFKDAKRAARIMDDLHKWVRSFKDDLEILRMLHQHADVAALGLVGAVELRRILLGTIDPSTKQYELKTRPQIEAKLSENLALGRYQSQPALIEYKSYEPNADAVASERTTYRVCQLVALLNRSQHPEAVPSLRVLPCIGYYIEPAESRYSFIYNIPSELRPEPVSLLTAIKAGEHKYRSTIKHRLQLAYTLSLTIYQLHLVGWVHKSIRSENILFFPDVSAPANNVPGPDAAPAVPDALLDRRTRERYLEPWLFGFEYSRVISQDSDLAVTDTSIAKNIYRHPDRWNAPTHRFGAIHDIYALGTVLLEIGLWRSLLTLSESGFARAAEAASSADIAAAMSVKEGVKAQLLQYAAKRLPFTMGRSYCEIVELCLSGVHRGVEGRKGFDVDENDHSALEKSFREKVVDRLGKAFISV
ncbi:MAG: hypothetical protein Q9166_000959 [cf. Caloplaca sp. 2 TL-2023]